MSRIQRPKVPQSPDEWFASNNWQPLPFQREVWDAYRNGESGLIHATTGAGKTYAAFFGLILEGLAEPPVVLPALRVLWITPLRALAADTALALERPLAPLGLRWDVGIRNADSSSSIRAKQKKRLPTVFVTTPESLALQLTHADSNERFGQLRCIVVDEWHELLSSKRGVLTELALARLRTLSPDVKTWGLSATIGNLDEALTTLLGPGRAGRIIRGNVPKPVKIDSLLPDKVDRFPWAGHLGLSMLPKVIEAVGEHGTSLIFTNTRSQTELWYRAILQARPDWAGIIALHHGSIDRKSRDWVEDQLRIGKLRCVVCTSTLDLGVDFSPVDRVLQIGSPKGIARLIQRAGRSGHQPGRESRITCVPTNSLELIEVAAARSATEQGAIESREPISKPLDVLAQHAISCALAGGFQSEQLVSEVRTTRAYQSLSNEEWEWVLDFITRGGEALRAYPDYRRVELRDGMYQMTDARLARRHRQSIGTITSDAMVEVRFPRGKRLGQIEETFIAKLKQGDRFTFAGRSLEFIRVHEMTAHVRLTKRRANTVPRWYGGRLPWSGMLAESVRVKLDEARRGLFGGAEMAAIRPILELQARWSNLPSLDQILVERLETRDGYHIFVYPFEGRLVHEGMAALAAYRLTQNRSQTLTLAVNDHGWELVSAQPIELTREELREALRPEGLGRDVMESLNAAELAKRQFREVARVAGLVHPGLPFAGRSAKQLQASSGLFYEVFREHDPGNLLLHQARTEVLDQQFEGTRMRKALDRIAQGELIIVDLPRPSPLAFPLLVEKMRGAVSSETLVDRVRRMVTSLEKQADLA